MLGVVVSSQCVAHNFSELCRSLNVQEHCFSLGPTSRLVASELASMPEARARHKVCVHRPCIVSMSAACSDSGPLYWTCYSVCMWARVCSAWRRVHALSSVVGDGSYTLWL